MGEREGERDGRVSGREGGKIGRGSGWVLLCGRFSTSGKLSLTADNEDGKAD